MQLLPHQRPDRRRAAPEVVIDRRRYGGGGFDLTDRVTGPIGHGVGASDRSERAAAQVLADRADHGAGAPLGADLHDAIVFPRGGDHLAALPDVVGERFLHVDVLAGLAGPHRGQGMPMIGSDNHRSVDRLIVEHAAEVGVGRNRFTAFFELGDATVEDRPIDVAKRGDADAGHCPKSGGDLQAATAHADTSRAKSDDGDANLAVGAGRLNRSRSWQA